MLPIMIYTYNEKIWSLWLNLVIGMNIFNNHFENS
jgi:hypothetical protein